MLKKIFDYFLFTSLFIALCAMVMVLQTNQLLGLEYDYFAYLGFVFSSTICSYNFHWYLTPFAEGENYRAQWTRKHKALHITLFVVGMIGSAYFFFQLLYAWLWLFVPVILTFLYSAPKIPHKSFHLLRQVAIGKTIFLSFVWMYVTTLLPILLHEGPVGQSAILFCCSRFFLIYAICIIFDYRDRIDDKKQGIRSLITYLNEKGINILFYGSLLIFLLSTAALYFYHFTIIAIFFLLVPGAIVAALFTRAKRNFSDYMYYFVLDGLMMFSALFTFFLRF
jgi:4-hydroxybenzoate polyprenyltransferase